MNKPDLRDYVDVATRIAAFKERYPDGTLQSEVVELTDKRVVVKAYAYRDQEDKKPAVGHAAEPIPGSTPYTRGSELMVCETSAWGRAIAALGFEVKRGIATQEEIQAAQDRQVGEPLPPRDSDIDASLADVWKEEVVVIREDPGMAMAAKLVSAARDSQSGQCPRHLRPWAWKEGVAKASGRPYAFWSCDAPKGPDGFCSEKPPIDWVRAQEQG
jgi:hypothetical protein